MHRRKFMIGTAAVAAAAVARPAIVRAATEISFFFPVAVGMLRGLQSPARAGSN